MGKNEDEILESMRDDFASFIILNNNKKVKVINKTTKESEITIVKDLDIKIGEEFENVMYFKESIRQAELIVKINNKIHTYIIK